MSNGLKLFWIILIAVFQHKLLVKCEPNWIYEFLSIEVENLSPDSIYVDFKITRISRGVGGISGVLDIKEEWTNELYGNLSVFYSLTGSNYVRTPIQILPVNTDSFMNNYYKDYMQETFLSCSDNSPRIEDKFEPPLSKRTVHFENCIIPTENMPNRLKSGFYKLLISFTKQFYVNVIIIVKIEPKD